MKAKIAAKVYIWKIVWLIMDNWCKKMTHMAKSNGKTKIDFMNIEFLKFDIQTKMLLIDNLEKTCCK